MDINFRPLFWAWGIAGAVIGLLGAGVVLAAIALLRDHWR